MIPPIITPKPDIGVFVAPPPTLDYMYPSMITRRLKPDTNTHTHIHCHMHMHFILLLCMFVQAFQFICQAFFFLCIVACILHLVPFYWLSKCTPPSSWLCLAHHVMGAGDSCSQACSSCASYHWAYRDQWVTLVTIGSAYVPNQDAGLVAVPG